MSPKLPVISGKKAIKAFVKLGYLSVRQGGSHVRLRHPTDSARRPLIVPLHKELKPGLLRRLISDSNLTPKEFYKLLD